MIDRGTILSSSRAKDVEAWMDLFDEDSSEEGCEEQNPDDIEAFADPSLTLDGAPPSKKKKRSALKQKKIMLLALEELDEEKLSDSAGADIVKLLHMQVYPERSQLYQV